ncbi:hypothetical protein [Rhizobium sp. RAF56]|jgi:hypothetical protein|uniref:hypothetical protein n=1 Tax=Rhizobium sp. RAF56 TaxID=3233062 RepID=UPI003F9A0AAE
MRHVEIGRLYILAAAVAMLTGAAGSDQPQYFVRAIKDVSECHAQYSEFAPDWRMRRSFIVSKAGAGEHVINCLPDGVAEYVCDPSSGKLTAATMQGGSLKACKTFYPRIPFTLKTNLLQN